ncbi:MAG: hydroxylase [Flavobacterium sp.]
MKQHLNNKDKQILINEIEQAELQGHLTTNQLAVLYNNNLFNLFVPKDYNGLELDFIKALEVEEELAHIDGSLGWTVTLCSGANMFVGFINVTESKTIFSNPKVCFGGSGKVGGIAKEEDDAYIINGHWDIITGLKHCTVFTANCQLEINGVLQYNDMGNPIYKSFFFLPSEVQQINSWETIGLIATGSHSIKAVDLHVPKSRSFNISSETCTIDNALYRFPFYPFAKFTLAVNLLGMQGHFLEEMEVYFNKLRGGVYEQFQQELLTNLYKNFHTRREAFYDLASTIWQKVQEDIELTEAECNTIDTLCKEVVYQGRDEVIQNLPYLGINGVSNQSPISRIVRDILTACQHSLFL